MKQLFPEEFVEELRKRVDIVDVVSEHVQMRRAGRSFVGLCPFHNERSPSFSVSPERQMFHCFGCGAGGTVFRFVMDADGISFSEAIVHLAERVGMSLPDGVNLSESARPADGRFQQLRDAHELTAKLYSYILMNTDAGVQALKYLQERGISRQIAVDFRMGYSPDARDTAVKFLEKRGFSPGLVVEAGLAVAVGEQILDRFRGRLMIPIMDIRGQVIAFGGRTMLPEGKPKYLNSPETDLFHKGLLLYNHQQARKAIRKSRSAVLVEGYMDVISTAQANVQNCVASLGTSLTPEQAQLLKRDCDTVVVAYDGDKAGTSAAERALPILETAGLHVRVVRFPKGMDPDEFIRSQGAANFSRQLAVHAESPVQFLMGQIRTKSDLLSPPGRTDFLRSSLSLLAERATPIEQEVELRNLSQEFGVSIDTLKEELKFFTKENKSKFSPKPVQVDSKPSQVLPKGYVQAGNRLLQAMLWDASVCQFLMDNDVDELALPEQTALLAILYGWRLSTQNPDPASFLDSLEDDVLLRLASSLLVEEPFPVDRPLLLDYIRTIQVHHLESEKKAAYDALVKAQLQGHTDRTTEIKLQIDELQRQIAARRVPHNGQLSSGVKEAGMK